MLVLPFVALATLEFEQERRVHIMMAPLYPVTGGYPGRMIGFIGAHHCVKASLLLKLKRWRRQVACYLGRALSGAIAS